MVRLCRWLLSLIEEVPGDLATCEFDCSRTQCRYRDWEACTRAHRYTSLMMTGSRPEPVVVDCRDT